MTLASLVLSLSLIAPSEVAVQSGRRNGKALQSRGLPWLRGQDLNLRPSGYENAEDIDIVSNLQDIAGIGASTACDELARNPAIPHEPKGSDDSFDLVRLRALAVASHTLVAVDPDRARDLLGELLRRLDAAGRGQRR